MSSNSDIKEQLPLRLPHETDFQYAERKRKYDEHVGELGHERCETLSAVWSNMKFLQCRYSEGVEAQVIPWGGTHVLLSSLFSFSSSFLSLPSLSSPTSLLVPYSRELFGRG